MEFQFTEEQELLRKMVRQFAETEIRPNVMKFDEAQEFPLEIMKQAGELGLLGILVPEKYGGAEQGYVEYLFHGQPPLRHDEGANVVGHYFAPAASGCMAVCTAATTCSGPGT